jgi:hypothetical protein
VLLVAGGQHDPNIGWLLRRVLARGVAFADIISGPGLRPDVVYDLRTRTLSLNGKAIQPTGLFIRHNVFFTGYSDAAEAQADALNWFYFLRGWACSEPRVRCFNRVSDGGENNKVRNLHLALEAGLRVPDTIIGCVPPRMKAGTLIRKPVAGGELTAIVKRGAAGARRWRPYFHQPKLRRPEMRVFVIGRSLFACALSSTHVDYRDDRNARLEPMRVPKDIARGLLKLCGMLDLDFAAADFMLDADDRYRFLEINTQPMFIAFDKTLDGAICDAIIDHLIA